jgi:Tol biopolymer transport system component
MLTVAAIGVAVVASASANFPGKPGKIAFSWGVYGPYYRIQAMNPQGKGAKAAIFVRKAADLHAQGEPAYSADGSRIAFELDGDIYTIAADGTDLRQVTGGPDRDSSPAFSPTGTSLVFSRAGPGGTDIFAIGVDGSGLTQLTTDPGNDYDPTWSPNGRLVAFVSNRSGSSHVWLMRADGSYQHLLVPDNPHRADGQVQPEFSPNSHRIAVSRGAHLVTMRLDGSHRQVLNRTGILIQPTYSPNGRQIAAIEASRGSHQYSIVVMNVNGSHRHTIRSHIPNLYGIGWQPLPR